MVENRVWQIMDISLPTIKILYQYFHIFILSFPRKNGRIINIFSQMLVKWFSGFLFSREINFPNKTLCGKVIEKTWPKMRYNHCRADKNTATTRWGSIHWASIYFHCNYYWGISIEFGIPKNTINILEVETLFS